VWKYLWSVLFHNVAEFCNWAVLLLNIRIGKFFRLDTSESD